MKRNIMNYLFFFLILVLVIVGIIYVYSNKKEKENEFNESNNKQQETEILKDIRLGIAEYDTINPILSKNKNVQNISKLIFEPLLSINKDYKVECCLAKEWSKTNETTYVLKLRENVLWQDGTEFIASDVKFTIEQLKQIDSIYSSSVKDITDVEVIDSKTVKINLAKEIPFFEYYLTFPIISQRNYYGEDLKTSSQIPLGTGMYKIKEITDANISLEKYSKYWAKEEKNNKIESIVIHRYDKVGELYNDFKLGNIDLVHTDSDVLEDYIGTLGYNTKNTKGREMDFISINCQNEILSRKEVRQAIQYAIDKEGIVNNIFKGKYYVSNFPLDFGNYLYKEENSNLYNTDKTKQILQENGWNLKSNIWQKRENYKNYKLSFTLTVLETNQKRLEVAENIKNSLEQLGFKITIRKVSQEEYQKTIETKNYELLLTGIYNSFSPDLTYFFGENNIANYYNETAVQILKEINSITDEILLQQKINELYKIYQEEVPYINLYRNRETTAYSQKLTGNIEANCYNIFYNIEDWYRQ